MSETWQRTFDFASMNGGEVMRSIALHPAGGYVIGGYLDGNQSRDPLCIRLDSNGVVAGASSFTGDPYQEDGFAMSVGQSGAIYSASSPFFFGYADVWLVKHDAIGSQVWVAGPIGGPADEVVTARELVLDASENSFIGCTTAPGSATTSDFLVLSYDSAGVQRFATVIDGPAGGGDELYSLCRDGAGDIVAVGRMDMLSPGSSTLGVVKLDASGNVSWIRTTVAGGPSVFQYLYSVACDAGNNIYACGSFGFPPVPYPGVLVSYDPSGQLRWTAVIPTAGHTILTRVVVDPWGNPIVAGSQGLSGIVVKFDPAGNVLWSRTTPWNIQDLQVGADGDVTVGGDGRNAGPADMLITRWDASGNLRWSHAIDHVGQKDRFGALVVAPGGRVGVAGWTEPMPQPFPYQPPDALIVELRDQAESFCYGDGLGTACPCGNSSAPGAQAGCANSLGMGARLSDAGIASIANDTLVLTTTGVGGPVMFFQGTLRIGGGSGLPFGDGLRCVGGTIRRLGIVSPAGGFASYPGGAFPQPVHVAGGVGSGDVRHYQSWYRNAAPFCTTNTFNLTQGLTINWGP